MKLVHIADTAEEFVKCCDLAMQERRETKDWLENVDSFLSGNSWEATFVRMASLEKDLPKKRKDTVRIERIIPITISSGGVH
jgi:hypothetical protein